MFWEAINNFRFTDFKKNLKIVSSCVGKFYRVTNFTALLTKLMLILAFIKSMFHNILL